MPRIRGRLLTVPETYSLKLEICFPVDTFSQYFFLKLKHFSYVFVYFDLFNCTEEFFKETQYISELFRLILCIVPLNVVRVAVYSIKELSSESTYTIKGMKIRLHL